MLVLSQCSRGHHFGDKCKLTISVPRVKECYDVGMSDAVQNLNFLSQLGEFAFGGLQKYKTNILSL